MSEAVDDSEVSKASSVVSGGECCKKSTTAYLQAVPEENNMTSFHIPESNASDITESSSHYHRKGKPVQAQLYVLDCSRPCFRLAFKPTDKDRSALR